MHPGCWCRNHDLEGRVVYDMHEMDPEQNEVGLCFLLPGPRFSVPSIYHGHLHIFAIDARFL